MKVALITVPFFDPITPPLESARLAGVLARQPGIDVILRDVNVEMWNRVKDDPRSVFWSDAMRMAWLNPLMVKRWWENRLPQLMKTAEEIAAAEPEVVVLSLSAASLYSGFLLAQALRKIAPKLVLMAVNQHLLLGSQGESEHWKTTYFLENSIFDIVLIGPSLDMFAFFLKDWPEHRTLRPRPGFHCRENGRVMYGAPPLPLRHPDRVPFADFSLFQNALYGRPFWFPLNLSLQCPCRTCEENGLALSKENIWTGTRLFLEASAHRREFPRKAGFLVRYSGPLMESALDQFCALVIDDKEAGDINPWRWELHAEDDLSAGMFPRLAKAGCQRVIRERLLLLSRASEQSQLPLEEQIVFDVNVPDSRPRASVHSVPRVLDESLDVFYLPGLTLPGRDVREINLADLAAPASTDDAISDGDTVRAQLFEASRLLIHENRPAEALRVCLGALDRSEIHPHDAAGLFAAAYEKDMGLLWAVLKRFYAAEKILDGLPSISREQIWLNAPTLQSPQARPMDFQRQRRVMQVFRGNVWQRAFRFLLTAGARAARMKISKAKFELDRENNQFLLAWGKDRLTVDDVLRLCNAYFSRTLARACAWKAWRDGVLRERARQLLERIWLEERNTSRLISLRKRLQAADRILKSLSADVQREVWTAFCLYGRRAPFFQETLSGPWRQIRRIHRMRRATSYLLAAAARAAQVRGFKISFDLPPSQRLSIRCAERLYSITDLSEMTVPEVRSFVHAALAKGSGYSRKSSRQGTAPTSSALAEVVS